MIEKLQAGIEFLGAYPLWVRIMVPCLCAAVAVLLVAFQPSTDAAVAFRALRPPFGNQVNESIARAKDVTLIAAWLPQWVETSSIERAVGDGASVTLIFLDAESHALTERSLALGEKGEYGKHLLEAGYLHLSELVSRLGEGTVKERITVMEVESLPSALYLKCDRSYYVGTFFRGAKVSDTYLTRLVDNPPEFVINALDREIAKIRSAARRSEKLVRH